MARIGGERGIFHCLFFYIMYILTHRILNKK